MRVRLRVLGGKIGEEARHGIGASCYLLLITVYGKEYTYLIDCGIGNRERTDDDYRTWTPPVELEALEEFGYINDVFVSHIHRDHALGLGLEILTSHFSDNTRVICTRPTRALFPYVLHEQWQRSNWLGEEKPYSMAEMYFLMERMRPIPKPSVIELVPDAIKVNMDPSGHTHGSCSFTFQIQEGRNIIKIMFSGDCAIHHQGSLAGAPLPPKPRRPDIIASFDCTNGALPLTSWNKEVKRFQKNARQTVKKGGYVFAFASAFDRSQIVARKLADAQIPVLLDGSPSIRRITSLLQSEEGSWSAADPATPLHGIYQCQDEAEGLLYPDPCAIVGPSGHGHGPAMKYLVEFLPRENAHVAAPGFLPFGSNGNKIIRAKRGAKIILEGSGGSSIEISVNARCERYIMTAHSLRDQAVKRIGQLLEYSQFKNIHGYPLLGLSHGTTAALDWFENALRGLNTFRTDQLGGRDVILYE